MKVYLFRHAERTSDPQRGRALTAQGFRQAQRITEKVLNAELEKPDRLLVSPQSRSQDTFEHLSQNLQLKLQIHSDLNERVSGESAEQFALRVRRFINEIAQSSRTTFFCTHLDWIEEALIAIPSDVDLLHPRFQPWTPGNFIAFDIRDGIWHFETFGGTIL